MRDCEGRRLAGSGCKCVNNLRLPGKSAGPSGPRDRVFVRHCFLPLLRFRRRPAIERLDPKARPILEARKQSKNTLLDIFERYIEGYYNLYNTF